MFRNRYGVDKLSIAMVIAAVVISVVAMFLGYTLYVVRYVLTALSTALIVLAFYRAFSRNFAARERELHKYMNIEYRIVSFFKGIRKDADKRRHYKYFRCPKCRQKLRVPRGKGRVRVRCAKCSYQFEIKA